MLVFKFEIEKQESYYNEIKEKLKTQFYQKLNFYVLPFMPVKFRSRVIFLPEECRPLKIYTKHKRKILKLGENIEIEKDKFIKNLLIYFPEIDTLNILITPSLYGSMGSFDIEENKIIVRPRYDRGIIGLQKLIINALVRYQNPHISWEEVQIKTSVIQNVFFPNKKSLLKILDTEFAGKLAEESARYLERLKASSKFEVVKPENLTKSERNVLNLLLRNKNKLVTFDNIAEEIWRDKVFEKYSEYAITTIVKKIKKKLLQKTDKHIIHAQRGVGYILHT